MKAILARTPSFATRVFSDDERAYCESTTSPEVHFATRFAAKEAVVKALGTGFSRGIGVRDIEVRRNAKGRPYVVLSGRAKEIAREQGVRELPVSLSFTHTEAVACAMAITEDSLRAAEKRVDPMEELSKQFKEARSMLDEIGEQPAPSADEVPAKTSSDEEVAAR
ncbi:holo-[acyl-carrier-protein] synthase [Gordonibacter sp. 28C]|nr:holo-[acyl-carrier-protein] synthase [Gordonibacter sp. 28C]